MAPKRAPAAKAAPAPKAKGKAAPKAATQKAPAGRKRQQEEEEGDTSVWPGAQRPMKQTKLTLAKAGPGEDATFLTKLRQEAVAKAQQLVQAETVSSSPEGQKTPVQEGRGGGKQRASMPSIPEEVEGNPHSSKGGKKRPGAESHPAEVEEDEEVEEVEEKPKPKKGGKGGKKGKEIEIPPEEVEEKPKGKTGGKGGKKGAGAKAPPEEVEEKPKGKTGGKGGKKGAGAEAPPEEFEEKPKGKKGGNGGKKGAGAEAPPEEVEETPKGKTGGKGGKKGARAKPLPEEVEDEEGQSPSPKKGGKALKAEDHPKKRGMKDEEESPSPKGGQSSSSKGSSGSTGSREMPPQGKKPKLGGSEEPPRTPAGLARRGTSHLTIVETPKEVEKSPEDGGEAAGPDEADDIFSSEAERRAAKNLYMRFYRTATSFKTPKKIREKMQKSKGSKDEMHMLFELYCTAEEDWEQSTLFQELERSTTESKKNVRGWRTYAQILQLYGGDAVTAKAIADNATKSGLSRPHKESGEKESTQYYVIVKENDETLDSLKNSSKATVEATLDAESLKAVQDSKMFSVKDLGVKGIGKSTSSRPKEAGPAKKLTGAIKELQRLALEHDTWEKRLQERGVSEKAYMPFLAEITGLDESFKEACAEGQVVQDKKASATDEEIKTFLDKAAQTKKSYEEHTRHIRRLVAPDPKAKAKAKAKGNAEGAST